MKFDGALDPTTASAAALAWRTFLFSAVSGIPTGATIAFQSAVPIFDTSGAQTDEITMTTVPTSIAGSGSGGYAGGSGAVVTWLTGVFHLGRRVRGRTFLVPLQVTAFQADGTLASAFQSQVQAAGNTFAASTPKPVIRSVKTSGGGTPSAVVVPISGCSVPDRAAVLRSRRD